MASSDAAIEARMNPSLRAILNRGVAIPAHPLALDAHRRLDERRQRALTRYYIAAGVGGLAASARLSRAAALASPCQITLTAPMDRSIG